MQDGSLHCLHEPQHPEAFAAPAAAGALTPTSHRTMRLSSEDPRPSSETAHPQRQPRCHTIEGRWLWLQQAATS